jgi:hypothetical protein
MVLERKVAFINLTDDSIEIRPVPLDLRKKFLGRIPINLGRRRIGFTTGIKMVFRRERASKGLDWMNEN